MEEGEIVGQHSVRYLGYIDFVGKWGCWILAWGS